MLTSYKFECDKQNNLLPYLLFQFGGFLLYMNTLGNYWTFDDFPVIVYNQDIQSIGHWLQNTYPGRPIRELTYLLDRNLFGMNPVGWHLQNIFWHSLNASLIFLLLKRIQARNVIALCTSILFLVHPIQVEVVAQISHRKDSLALAFSLISLLFFIEYYNHEKKHLFLLLSCVSLTVGVLSKANAISTVALMVVYEVLYIDRDMRTLTKKPYYLFTVLIIAFTAFTIWVLWGNGAEIFVSQAKFRLQFTNIFDELTPSLYILTMLKSWSFMFTKLIFPFDLSVNYMISAPDSLLDRWVVLSLTIIALYLILIKYSWKKNHILFFGLTWFAVFWLPTSNIWPFSYFAADRYLYASSTGFFIVFSHFLLSAIQSQSIRKYIFITIITVLCITTWKQNKVWANNLVLWKHSLKINPESYRAISNIGLSYIDVDNEKALEYMFKAEAINPYDPPTQCNIAFIYEKMGKFDLALQRYEKFFRLYENNPNPTYKFWAEPLRKRLQKDYRLFF